MYQSQEENSIDINLVKKSIESIETIDINFSDTSQSINKLQGNMFEFKIGSRNNIDAKMCVFINQNIITSFILLKNQGEEIDTETHQRFQYKRYQNIDDLRHEIERVLKEINKSNE